jgi:hypothetical protein
MLGVGGDDASVVQHDIGTQQVVQRQPGHTVQGAVAAAEGQARHADQTEIARRGHQAAQLRRVHRVSGGGSAGDHRDAGRAIDVDPPHSRHVDDEAAVGQRPSRPVVTAAAHRNGRAVRAGTPHRRGYLLGAVILFAGHRR